MGTGTELVYCDWCGNPVPPDRLKEKNGLMLCTVGMKCYYERESYIVRKYYPTPDDYREFAEDYEHDLFEQMARCLRPDND